MKIIKYILCCVIFFTSSIIYAQKPMPVCEKSMHNFGVILEKDGKVTHTFIIKNMGKAPMVINKIEASCGCTTSAYSKKPIAPGETTEVKITFDPTDRPGIFSKAISIYTNATSKSLNLRIRGEVK